MQTHIVGGPALCAQRPRRMLRASAASDYTACRTARTKRSASRRSPSVTTCVMRCRRDAATPPAARHTENAGQLAADRIAEMPVFDRLGKRC